MTPPLTLSQDRIVSAILSTPTNPIAREQGARLVDAWREQWAEEDGNRWQIVAVETPWYLWLEDHTLLVGMMDLLARDEEGLLGGEWKTHKAPRIRKDGEPYKGEGAGDWLEEIKAGIQLGCYGLAMLEGSFVSPFERDMIPPPPRLMVRAITKADVPEFWPPDPNDGYITFDLGRLTNVENALLSRASQIRAARQSERLPWQWVGYHCGQGDWRCGYYAQCAAGAWDVAEVGGVFDKADPGYQAIEASGADLDDPDLVVLSASSYETSSKCLEKYRRIVMGGEKEISEALEVGTVVHAGVAEMYRQIMEQQQGNTEEASDVVQVL